MIIAVRRRAPPRYLQSRHEEFPDDDSIKRVFLQAEDRQYSGIGDRHVLIWWSNETDAGAADTVAVQMVQLTGGIGGFAYYAPVVKKHNSERHEQFFLGDFSRAQRDQTLELAAAVEFNGKSHKNSCRAWTRDLLVVAAGVLTPELFDEIDQGVPLVKRVPESDA